jgi:hypothetical protein
MVLICLSTGPAGAAPDIISNITISDVRNASFVVSWITDTDSNGTVTYGTTISPPPAIAVPDLVNPTTTHYVRISGLLANTPYYFQVSSGGDVDNNGSTYYRVITGPPLFAPPGNIVQGHVYQSNGSTVVPNAIVYLQLQDANSSGSPGNSQLVSARADSGGGWSYNLGNIRTSDFQNLFSFTPGADNLRIIGEGGSQGTRGFDLSPWIIQTPTLSPYTIDIILDQSPTAVTLASFTGSSQPNRVQLDWATGTETGLVGFNLYRSETQGGVKQKLNASLIQAKTPGGLIGNSYQFQDGSVVSGKTYSYWIELVMQEGGNQDYGPVSLLAPYWLWLPMTHR